MLLYADHDAIPTHHIADFFALLGGGLKDPGWQDTKFTNARLAIVPGYSHYNFFTAPELASNIDQVPHRFAELPAGGRCCRRVEGCALKCQGERCGFPAILTSVES